MKKLLRSFAATALVSAGAAALALGVSGCMGKTTASSAPSDTQITRLQPPADGSLPTAHTAQENLAYMAYVLDGQSQYNCYTYTVTQASIATQYTKSYKDFRNGVAVSSDITYSDMVKSGSQACFVMGEDGPEAYMRFSSAPDASTTHLTAAWSTGAPTYFDEQTYLTTYGLFQTEMTNYIINEVTITDSSVVVDNRDGTYTQSVTLDPVSSTYYYQYGMKNRGGLTGFPQFQNVSLVFTFDSSWRVLTIDVNEVAKVNKGVEVTSVSTSHVQYSYDPADFDEAHFSYYESYFRQYVGSEDLLPGGGSSPVLDATGVLANGFADILNGGCQFAVEVTLGDKIFAGYIFIGLDLADPLGTLDLALQLGRTAEEQGLFVEYADGVGNAYIGNDFAMTVNVAALSAVIDGFTAWADGINDMFASAAQDDSSSSGDVLGDLFGLFELTYDEQSANIALVTDDLLGLGVGVDAQLNFSLGEDGAVSFTDASVNGLTLGGSELAVALAIRADDSPRISHDPVAAPADLSSFASDIFALLSSDCVAVNISLNGDGEDVLIPALKGVRAEVNAYVDADGIAAAVLADVSYAGGGHTISAEMGAYYNYNEGDEGYGELVVEITSLNGVPADIRAGCSPQELASAVSALLKAADIDTGGLLPSGDDLTAMLADVINGVLSADFSSMITELSADADGLHLTVDTDEIIGLFADTDMKFGTLGLDYTAGGGEGGSLSASLSALGLSMSVAAAGEEVPAPSGSYLNIADLLNVVAAAYGTIDDIIDRHAVTLFLPADGNVLSYGGLMLDVSGAISAKWGDGGRVAADLNVRLSGEEGSAVTNIRLIYNAAADDDLPLVRLSVNGASLDVYGRDLAAVRRQIAVLSSVTGADLPSLDGGQKVAAALLALLSGTDWVELLNDMTLVSDGNSALLSYIGEKGEVALSLVAGGGLSVGLSASWNALSYTGRADVVGADIYSYVDRQIDLSGPASTSEGASFTKVIYDYVFDAFNSADLAEVLGGAYSVQLELNGASSGIDALGGVDISAELSFAQYDETSNAAALRAAVGIDGVRVDFEITLIGERFYVAVTNICGNAIPALRLTTTADSLYGLLSQLVGYALNAGVLGGQTAAPSAEQTLGITDILYSLALLDFGEYVTVYSYGEKGAVEADLGGLLSALGIEGGEAAGLVTVVLDGHSFNAVAAADGAEWLSVGAGLSSVDLSSFDKSGYIDFSGVTSLPVADVLALVGADVLRVDLDLVRTLGDGHSVAVAAEAYINVNGLAVAAAADFAYVYGDISLTAHFTAEYAGDELCIRIDGINGAPCSLGVFCNVAEAAEAVKNLLAAVQVGFGGTTTGEEASDLLGKVFALDFSSVLSNVYADGLCIKADVNLDALADGLGIGVPDLGVLTLELRDGVLSGSAAQAGLSLSLSGAGSAPAYGGPSAEGCVDLADLAEFVAKVSDEIEKIVNSQSLAFAIEQSSPAYISADGITASVWGDGEISWAAGGKVALDLSVALSGGVNADVLSLQLIYDGSASGDRPFITLAINGTGVQMTHDDMQGMQTSIDALVGALAELTGNSSSARTASVAAAPDGDDLVYAVLSLFSGTDWVEALGSLTLATDGNSAVISWAQDNLVAAGIGENGIVFTCRGTVSGGGAWLGAGAEISLSASSGALGDRLAADFSGPDYSIASSANGQNFIKNVYDNLFEAIRSVSLENILGDGVYALSIGIDGASSGIDGLRGVKVRADMYVKNNAHGGKTAMVDLDLNVNGAAVVGSVIIDGDVSGRNTDFYIDLTRALNVTLNGLKVKASQDTLYNTVRALVDVLCDTDILSVLMPLFSAQSGQAAALSLTEEQKASLAGILSGLLGADWGSFVCGATADGVTCAVVDLDGIMNAIGIRTGSLGALECRIDHASHSLSASAAVEDGRPAWLSLSSSRLTRAEADRLNLAIDGFDALHYIDIAFLPALVDDLRLSATDDEGAMYDALTFTGSVTGNAVGILDISVSDIELTVNLDPADFYFSFEGTLNTAKAIGITVISEHRIGVTYHGGYLTLYRNLGGADEYRVMTMEYFLDYMFADEDASTLNWLLQVKQALGIIDVWGIICGQVPAVDSGLTTPQDVYLYDRESEGEEEEVTVDDYINAISVMIGGQSVLEYTSGNNSAQTMFGNLGMNGGEGNYYAFDLNASLITGDILTALSAAVIRNENGGISGVKAYGDIQGYLNFKVDLTYDESVNGTTALSSASHFNAVEDAFNAATDGGTITDTADGADGIFGCYNSADGSVAYSYVLDVYTLSVVDNNGNLVESRTVRDGSTVYLYDNAYPVYADDSKQFRVVYYKDGELCSSFVLTGDTTVVVDRARAVDFTVKNSRPYAEGFIYHSFVGDTLPADFGGYTALNAFVFEGSGQPVAGTVVTEDTIKTIIGTYAQEVVTVDSVVYTFSAETQSYGVTGPAAGFRQTYVLSNNGAGRTLVLENEINGVPVTHIAEGAFANTSGEAARSVKNIVVPANITTVGARAFLDNYGMQSAVFLAENVLFLGSQSDKTLPFYGCSAENGGETTELSVYYTSITAQSGRWNHFRTTENWGTFTFFIGETSVSETWGGAGGGNACGGAIVSDGWQYVNIGIENSTEYDIGSVLPAYLSDGLNTGVADADAIRASLQTLVNEYTSAQYGATDYYVVMVSSSKDSAGVTQYNISLSEAEFREIEIVSSRSFTYGGVAYGAGTNVISVAVAENGGMIMYAPLSEGATFYGWYADEAFTVPVTSFDERTERLVIRWQYDLTIAFANAENSSSWGTTYKTYFYVNNAEVGNGGDCSYTVKVPEGAQFSINASENVEGGSGLVITDGSVAYSVHANRVKKPLIGSSSVDRRETLVASVGSFTVSGNVSVTLTRA